MDLTQFLELFHPLPGNHYIQITTQADAVTLALYDKIKAVDGEFHLALYEEAKSQLPPKLLDAKIQIIGTRNTPFRALPRDNDVVVFKDIFTYHRDPELLLRIAYTTLANTANVVIAEKKNILQKEETLALLEKYEFRAGNFIEDILEGYDVFSAKKMHMWNNGL